MVATYTQLKTGNN